MAAPKQTQDRTFTEVGIPALGMDTDTVPRLLPSTKAPLLKNFLMDRPGVLPMRGPLCEGLTWNLGASIGLGGAWANEDAVLISRYAASATAIKDYWTLPYRRTDQTALLRSYSLTMKHVDLTTGTVTDVAAADQNGVIGLKSIRVGVSSYGLGASGTAFGVIGGYPLTYRYPRTKLLRWDSAAVAPTVYANAPQACQDLIYHYNRIFVLAGEPADHASPYQSNVLFWSDALADNSATPLPDTVAAWQDDVSGLTNQLSLGGSRESDSGVALAHVGTNLLILRRKSLFVLYGTSPANFSLRQVSNTVGCIDPRSVVEYEGGVYFMSERGFMFYDGTRIQTVSGALTSSLIADALSQVGPQGVDGGYCRSAQLDRGYILVTTGATDGATLAATADADAWLLHAPTGAWQQLSSGALSSVLAGGRTVNNTFLLTDQRLVKANYLFTPQNAPAGTRGFDSIDSGATKFVIPSRWTTRTLSLGTPPRKSKLQRIVADYYWSLANGGWQITTNTRGDTGVVNTAGTVAAPTGITASLPARGAVDVFNETDELYLDIAASSSAAAAFNDAELHRVLIESQSSHRTAASL